MPDGAFSRAVREAEPIIREAMDGEGIFTQHQDARLPSRSQFPYGAIVHHIRENLARRITVDELANIARLSVFQLSRAFRRDYETTPYRLVLEIRIRHATYMLGAGASIAETALRAGFADQSHFTRHFKRKTGVTPSKYALLPPAANTPN